MKKCIRCGYSTEEDVNFCPECGYKMKELQAEQNDLNVNQIKIINCPMCGKPNNADVKFCINCGTKLNDLNLDSKTKIKKPKSRKKIALGITIPVVAFILLSVFIAAFFPKIQMAVLGQSGYYFYQESKNIASLFQAEMLSDLRHPNSYSARSVIKADYSGDEFVSELLDSMQATASVDYDAQTATVKSSATLMDSGNTLFTLNGNYINSNFVIGSDFSDSSLVFSNPLTNNIAKNDTDDESGSYNDNASEDYYEEYAGILNQLNQIDSKELLKVLRNISSEYIDAKAVETDMDINGENADLVTFAFSGDELDAILIAFINEIQNDSKLVSIAENILCIYMQDDEFTLKDLKDFTYESGMFAINQLEFSYACDSKGNIIYRSYEVEYGNYTAKGEIYTSFDEFGVSELEAEIIPDTESYESVSFLLKKQIANGSMNVDVQYSDIYTRVQISISDMHSEKCNGVSTLLGQCRVNCSSGDESVLSLNISADNLNNEYDVSVNGDITYGGSFDGTISTSLSTDSDVTGAALPSNYETNIEEYMYNFFEDIGSKVMEYVEDNYYYY